MAGWNAARMGGVILSLAGALPLPLHATDVFMKPTKEELAMTSLPGYPGVSAVVLFHEEIIKDDLHQVDHYERVKILTEEGKKYANVDLTYGSFSVYDTGDLEIVGGHTIDNVVGRTIHADGTIVPFTGKPYEKTLEKGSGFKVQAKVFTLPDVDVGSIIEYRYTSSYNDYLYSSPTWVIQGSLYLKSAHYAWYPTSRPMVQMNTGAPINAISLLPILPAGAEVQRKILPGTSASGRTEQMYELNIKDVPPVVHEEFMPPVASFSYRVIFNYTPYTSAADYWSAEGKGRFRAMDTFIGPNSDLIAATGPIVAGATTQEQKLQKIFAAVMDLENTDYTRTRAHQEDKAAGLGKVLTAADVLAHKRGDGSQLTELFIGMARAAGMKAYLMFVPDRSRHLFLNRWMSFSQFSRLLAIVNVDGKERYFDPGSRYCPFGHLDWESTYSNGLREIDNGIDFATTPGDPYTVNATGRAGNLAMDEQGVVKGTLNVSFSGAAALEWRQEALRGDEASLRQGLRRYLEEKVPSSMKVVVLDIQNLTDYEKPLLVNYYLKGSVGTLTGKRLLVPVDLFLSQSRATFPQEKRDVAVYFHYAQIVQDALRITLPKNMTIEGSPASSKFDLKGRGSYTMTITSATDSLTVRRVEAFASVLVNPDDYTNLRTYFSQFEAKDQESFVLRTEPVDGVVAAPAGN